MRKLWLIDDDENEHLLVRRALKSVQLSVALESFKDPAEAMGRLGSLKDGFPDLVICDLELGNTSGIDFLKWLRSSPMAAIPVVIRSDSSSQQNVDAAYQHGANCYLQKGFSIEEIEKNFKLLLHFWSTMRMPDLRLNATR